MTILFGNGFFVNYVCYSIFEKVGEEKIMFKPTWGELFMKIDSKTKKQWKRLDVDELLECPYFVKKIHRIKEDMLNGECEPLEQVINELNIQEKK